MSMIQTGIQLNDEFTSVLYGIINAVNVSIATMEEMNQTMNTDIGTESFDYMREQISEATLAVDEFQNSINNVSIPEMTMQVIAETPEIKIPDTKMTTVEIPVQWKTDNLNVFAETGLSRFEQEIQSANEMLNMLSQSQNEIAQNAAKIDVIAPGAAQDISLLTERIEGIREQLETMSVNVVEVGTDEANAELERLRSQLNQALERQEVLNSAMESMDISQINNAYINLSRTISNTERQIRDSANIGTVEIPVQWKTDNLNVFAETGLSRFEQEIQSANEMLNMLSQSQNEIAQNAAKIDVIAPGAAQDISSMTQRIQNISDKIQEISENTIKFGGTDEANAELERLRSQLNQALERQEALNSAMESMDISQINSAYINLSRTIDNTEMYIRDNISEQQNFNDVIQQGTTKADSLVDTIKRAVVAYASMQSIKEVIGLSDTMTQTSARLELIVDDDSSVDELQNKIYEAAQSARGSYQLMADAVSKMGMQASQSFTSNDELIAFTELLNKQFVIAGTSAQGIDSVMLQLTQSMASGKLQGEELNAVLDNAAPIVQNIQKYLEEVEKIDASNIKELASEGVLTADIIKNAMFYAADETNAKFATMPMTWEQIFSSLKNMALMEFQPILQRINDIANTHKFQVFAANAISAIGNLANFVIDVFDVMAQGITWVADNWSMLSPVIYGVAAALAVYYGWQVAANTINAIGKGIHFLMAVAQMAHAAATGTLTGATAAEIAAQNGLNAAMYACPITWIVLWVIGLVAAFYAAVAAVNHFAGTSVSATGVIAGVIASFAAFVINHFIAIYNMILSVAEFFMNVWNEPVYAVKRLFVNLANTILDFCIAATQGFDDVATNLANAFISGANMAIGAINWIIEALNNIPGIDLDTVGKFNKVDNFSNSSGLESIKSDLNDWLGEEPENYKTIEKKEFIDISSAWNTGYSAGERLQDTVTGLFDFDNVSLDGLDREYEAIDYSQYMTNAIDSSELGDSAGNIADNTSDIKDSMDITEEDLKYLRDIAEQETINRFTTAEIKIEQTNNNNISGDMDLDGVVNGLTDAVNEAVEIIAEGVHD